MIVAALGVGLAALAAGPERQKVAARQKPATIILATVIDADPPAQCLLPPRDKGDERPIGEKSNDDKSDHRNQKKVIACG